MKIRRFFAKDMKGALSQVKQELGCDAVIMSKTKHDDGIEVVAAYDKEPVKPLSPSPAPSISLPRRAAKQGAMGLSGQKNKVTSLSEIIGDQGPDSLRALLDKQENAVEQQREMRQAPATDREPVPHQRGNNPQATTTDPQTPANNDAINDLKDELSSLRNVLQYQVSTLIKEQSEQRKPQHQYLRYQLQDMGLSANLCEQLVSYAPDQATEREAWLFVLKLLANKLDVPQRNLLQTGGVVSLIGPTGSGKTTTLAKLAAQYALQHGPNSVAMVTIDSYRIAAYEQLATFGKIIGCTVKQAANAEQLADVLLQLKDKKLVLIDTAGFSQRDSRLINQLDTLNGKNCGIIQHYIVLPANAQKQALVHAIESYQNIQVNGCILTKLDETYSLGESISALIEQQLPVCFITDGQKVPEDIKVAEAKYLVSSSAKLYQKYGEGVQQQVVSR